MERLKMHYLVRFFDSACGAHLYLNHGLSRDASKVTCDDCRAWLADGTATCGPVNVDADGREVETNAA